MDLSKFKTSDWLKVGGGALFLIAGFLPWWEVSAFGFSASANAFDYFLTGIIPWLIFVAIGVLTFLAAAEIYRLPDNLPVPTIFLGAAALGTLLVIFRFISDGEGGINLDRGVGLFLALLAAILVLVGCYLAFTESGGNLSELGKGLQNRTGGTKSSDAPPPPPPPPPPPTTPTV